MAKKTANVHRFHAYVALHVGTGETTYISPKEARKLARALNACARDIDARGFSLSTFSGESFEFAATPIDRR